MLGYFLAIIVVALAIELFRKVIIGYTIGADPLIWEKSTVKIAKADQTEEGWLVTTENDIEYQLPRLIKVEYDVPEEDGKMYFERSFQSPCVTRKRWFREDKPQYGPFELVQSLHLLRTLEKGEKF